MNTKGTWKTNHFSFSLCARACACAALTFSSSESIKLVLKRLRERRKLKMEKMQKKFMSELKRCKITLECYSIVWLRFKKKFETIHPYKQNYFYDWLNNVCLNNIIQNLTVAIGVQQQFCIDKKKLKYFIGLYIGIV